jgi:hypothetical protein
MGNKRLEINRVYQIIDGSRQAIKFGNETLDKLINETSFNKKIELLSLIKNPPENIEKIVSLLEGFKGEEFTKIYLPIVIMQPYGGKEGEREVLKSIKEIYHDSIILNEEQLLKIMGNLHEKLKYKSVVDYLIINADYIIGLEIKGKSLEELCNQKKKVWRKLKRFRK